MADTDGNPFLDASNPFLDPNATDGRDTRKDGGRGRADIHPIGAEGEIVAVIGGPPDPTIREDGKRDLAYVNVEEKSPTGKRRHGHLRELAIVGMVVACTAALIGGAWVMDEHIERTAYERTAQEQASGSKGDFRGDKCRIASGSCAEKSADEDEDASGEVGPVSYSHGIFHW